MPRATMYREEVTIPEGDNALVGDLVLPENVTGIVVFAHGSGSSRLSPRNRAVAEYLHEGGLGTLLFDLLTPAEQSIDEMTGHLRFDIELLSERMIGAVDWVRHHRMLENLPVGLFGASTGAAAAMVAAARRSDSVAAVVSRGGRPDLAGKWLPLVQAPTLLIVGMYDPAVIEINQQAADLLHAPHETQIIPGAGHLFTESGKLEEVAMLAREWFERKLKKDRRL